MIEQSRVLDYSLDFKEPLEVVDLAKCHCHEQEGLKHSPPHHAGISVVIDCSKKVYMW